MCEEEGSEVERRGTERIVRVKRERGVEREAMHYTPIHARTHPHSLL